jgi:hypothetical protein
MFKFYWGNCYIVAILLILYFTLLSRSIHKFYKIHSKNSLLHVNFTNIAYLIFYLAVGQQVLYLYVPNFSDSGEPVIPILARNLLNGAPVYGRLTEGNFLVGSNYGPYTFLTQIPTLIFFPNIFFVKIIGISFSMLSIYFLYISIKNSIKSLQSALVFLSLMISLFSFELHYWFWDRPDSMLIFLVSFGVLIFERGSFFVTLVVIGLLAGIMMNLKLFTPIYLLPLAISCLPRLQSWRAFVFALAVGGVLFFVAVSFPFLVWPNSFSLRNYLDNLMLIPNQGINISQVYGSLMYFLVIIALPSITFFTIRLKIDQIVFFVSLVTCAIFVALISGKPGGGTPYMMPFAPISIYFSSKLLADSNKFNKEYLETLPTKILSIVFVCASPIWAYSFYQMSKQIFDMHTELTEESELRSLFVAYPGAEMSYNSGKNQDPEFYRVQKAFLGQTINFDYVNFIDQRAAGVPAAVAYRLVESCRVPFWIISRDGGAFLGTGYGNQQIFNQGFLSRFYRNYELVNTYQYLEVWQCRR